jgi:hypothetical protein
MVVIFYKNTPSIANDKRFIELLIYNGFYNYIRIVESFSEKDSYEHAFITKDKFISKLGINNIDEILLGNPAKDSYNSFQMYDEEGYTPKMKDLLEEVKKLSRIKKIKDFIL